MASDILIKVGADITDFSKKMAESNKALGNFTKANQETFDAFKKTGAAVTGAGVALAGGLGYAVKVAADFESGMSQVAAVSGATGDELKALEDRARELGGSTSFSAKEAADGLQYLALAGWDTAQMVSGLEPVLHLAEAGALDLGRSADLVTDSMAGLGLGVEDLDGYLDKVAQTSRKSNTDIDALMEAFVIAGGTFSRLNVPLEESTAFLGVLANRGFKASEAGTAINAIMTRLTQTTGPAAEALEEMGVSAFDSEGNFRGMEAVLRDVEHAMSTMTDAERAHYQSQLAGLNHGKTFSAMLAGLGDEYDELKASIIDSDGALLEMRNTMKDNLQGALENLSSAFEEIMISIGSSLLPIVKQLTEWLQKAADWFNSLSDSTKRNIALISAVAAALMLIVGPILLLIGFIPQIIAGFTTAVTVIKAVGTAFGLIASPIGLVVLAIAGIIGALVLAYQKVEWFRDSVNEAWQWILEKSTAVFEAVKEAVLIAVDAIISFAKEKLSVLTDFWRDNGDQILQATQNIWNFIKGIIQAVMPFIEGIIKATWTVIKVVIMSVWENIKGVIDGALNIILGLVKTFSSLFTGDWTGVWEGVKQILKGAVEFLWNFVQLMLWGRLLKGVAVFAGSFRGIISSLWSVIRGIFTGAINAIRSFFTSGFNAMRSTANVTLGSIRTIVSTVWNTIRTIFTTVINVVRNTVQSGFTNVLNFIRNTMSRVLSTVKSILTGMVNAVKSGVSRFFNAGKDLIQGLINGIKNMTAAAVGAITGVVDGVVNKAKSLLGIASPSKVLFQIGKWTGEGLVKGITSQKRKVSEVTSELSDEIVKITDAKNQEVQKIERRAQEDINLIHAKAKKAKRKLTQAESVRIRRIEEDAASKLKKVNEDYYKKIEEMRKKDFDRSKEWIERKKKFDQLSLADELAAWERVQARFAKGTKEREDAEEQVYRVKKEVHEKLTKLNEELYQKSKEILEKESEDVRKLTEEYQKSVDDRAKSIFSFVNLFDNVDLKMEQSGKQLVDNLARQVSAMRQWEQHMNELAKRGVDDGLLAELRKMGPNALPQLLALTDLTDEKLTQYSDLYRQKTAMARELAENELIGMKEDTDKRISDIHKNTEEQLEELQNEWATKVKQIRTGTTGEFDVMKADLRAIGEDSMRGMISGLESMRGELLAKAQSIANAVKATMASALQIHSPSRWMRNMIGVNMMRGWIDGMEAMRSAVINVTKNAVDWMTPDVPTLSTAYTTPKLSGIKVTGTEMDRGAMTGGGGFNPTITNYFTPAESTPSESARKQRQALTRAAMEWGYR